MSVQRRRLRSSITDQYLDITMSPSPVKGVTKKADKRKKKPASPCSKMKKRRLSSSPKKSRNSTILLESSSELEIIENSIVETKSTFDWINTPRSARVNHSLVMSPKRSTPTRIPKTDKNMESWVCSLATAKPVSRFGSLDRVESAKNESPLAKLLAPNIPDKHESASNQNFLVGSKLRNVEAWVSAAKAQTPARTIKRRSNNAFSMDPKMEEILTSIYGDGWKKNNSEKKCQTDVKKTKPQDKRLLATDAKSKEISNNSTEIKPVRRKIFDETPKKVKKVEIDVDESPLSTPMVESKIIKRTPKRKVSIDALSTPSTTAATSSKIKTPYNKANINTPKRTFLASLAPSSPKSVSHPEALEYKTHFKKKRDDLCVKLFKLYNTEVFGNCLPEDMNITWNPRMRGTAGFCYCKRKRDRFGVFHRSARIELSPKVVDRADRLRDTLIHELCHAAAWLVDGILDGHGPVWIEWTKKATDRFPELPIIKRCHNYEIVSKFVYKCANCGYCIKRHSKSINLNRKRCGKCFGEFELFKTKKVSGNAENPEFDITKTMRAPNAFALFLKENYKIVQETNPDKKHSELMKIISQQYAVYKSVLTPRK